VTSVLTQVSATIRWDRLRLAKIGNYELVRLNNVTKWM